MTEYVIPRFARSWWRPWMGYALGLGGFAYATVGFFNVHFGLGLPKSFLNQYGEVFVIVAFGVPLIFIVRDRYQKVRMAVMVTLLFTFWYLVPTLWPFDVTWFGSARGSTFPSWDMPGTWTNAGLFVAALLFGRRIKCGWMNACVAIKETAGAPFRRFTRRGPTAFRLRWLKVGTGSVYVSYFVVLLLPESSFTEAFFFWFWRVAVAVYFASLFLSPIFGNRVWCRWVCPLLLGWANVLGFFRLRVARDRCTDCGACEEVCDFGLPIRELSKKNPLIRTTECMGCGRCRTACPNGAISFYDVRHFVRERLLVRDRAARPTDPGPEEREARAVPGLPAAGPVFGPGTGSTRKSTNARHSGERARRRS